jgi:hypothetical protein
MSNCSGSQLRSGIQHVPANGCHYYAAAMHCILVHGLYAFLLYYAHSQNLSRLLGYKANVQNSFLFTAAC